MFLKRIVFLLVFGINFVGFSQAIFLGLRLSASIGSHQHYYGVGVHAGLEYRSFMLTIGSDVSYRLKDLGERKQFIESRSYLGASIVTGKNTSVRDVELGALNNYFTRESSFGYAYIIYSDNAGTSQFSGAFKGEIKRHSLMLENDFFAGQGKDRFRTATLLYRYREVLWSGHLGVRLWTGEASGLPVKEIEQQGQSQRYKDLSSNPFGKTSHGILYGGVRYALWSQTLGMELGIDSEQVRHALQNQVAHSSLWHKRQPSKAVAYPMLDKLGYPTFDQTQVRLPCAYFQLSISGY
jgi:hypothetical protein